MLTENTPDNTNTATSGEAAQAADNQAAETAPPAGSENQQQAAGEHLLGGSKEPGESEASEGRDEAKAETKPEGEPEELELKIPDGFEADEETLTSFKQLAKEHGLTQEAAQTLVNFQAEVAKKAQEAAEQQWAETQKGWVTEMQQDKEFGGSQLSENLALANRVLMEFGGPELVEMLKSTGLSNHPLLVRTFIRLGKANAEDSIAGTATPPTKPKTLNERLAQIYDNETAQTLG